MMIIVKKMLKENNLCVLATCNDNFPNSSLMQYIYDDIGMNIFMLTLSGSLKHINITANPHVSLLIDTRSDVRLVGLPVMALTVYGKATVVADPQKQQTLIDQLVAKNSNLAILARDNRCLVIQMKIEKMLLLDGVNDKSTIEILD
ncbi:MAG: pyridoxamine 5'-phosphate oxidase family protein [Bacillota bacterium]|nr:pyridoxamine 5'-phosphate oxidase family protein [Bacillota bacterium]